MLNVILDDSLIDETSIDCLKFGEYLICPKGWRLCKLVGFDRNLQMYKLKCRKRQCYIRKGISIFFPIMK